jgi:CheY-like chemotaxis protein
MPHTYPVLIAEDDPDTVFFLERSLKRVGVKNPIKIVHDGAEALGYLQDEETHKTPRLAVLDIRMPLKSGLDVLKSVRSDPRLCRMPVIIFSSSAAASDVNQAYELGANSYVVKPGDPAEFDMAIQKIHDYWLSINQPPKID